MRSGVAAVGIRVDGDSYGVYALNPDGTRRRAVSSEVRDGWLRLVCDTGMDESVATYLYEIVRK